MDYRTFTTNLSNYNRYKEDLTKVETELEQIFYLLRGVKGVGYSDNTKSTNESQKALNWLTLDEKYNLKLREKEFILQAISQVENILERMPEELRNMLIKVYVDGWTFRKLGEQYGYSYNGMWQYLRREVERYL